MIKRIKQSASSFFVQISYFLSAIYAYQFYGQIENMFLPLSLPVTPVLNSKNTPELTGRRIKPQRTQSTQRRLQIITAKIAENAKKE